MRKISDLIVEKKNILFVCMLAVMALCAWQMILIPVNKDMSQYLSADSNMRQGMDLMGREFPAVTETAVIRVMFENLSDAEKIEMRKRLENIEFVSSVNYDQKSAEYNKDKHTLFIVHSEHTYGSQEERQILKSLKNDFGDYKGKMFFKSNSIEPTSIPLNLISFALVIMFVVLFLMSESWLEPIFYMATIGIAVIINLGTSFFFPFLAEVTVSMGPILQLALSMDYSIMLTDRYKQELRERADGDKIKAMKAALYHSFSSVAASSITTAAGLLALAFLTFRLGPEIGIMMAKGVFISMLCVFIVLPFFILKFDEAIQKSKKKALHIPISVLAHFSNKVRFAIPIIFVALFTAFFFVQRKTGISFTEGNRDVIAEVFPKDNPMVLLYHNEDEPQIEKIISAISEYDKHGKPYVKNIVGYSNTLNKKLSASEMTDAISLMSSNMPVSLPINESMISLLYYLKFDGTTKPIAVGDFLAFLKDNFANNDTFASYAGDMNVDMKTYSGYLEKFSSKEKLLQEISPAEMAEFFDVGAVANLAASGDGQQTQITAEDLEKLYLYYYTKKGGADYGTLTLPVLADFLLNTVATNEMYAAMFDKNTLAQLEVLKTFTNAEEMTRPLSYRDAAKVLGIDETQVKLLYVYYFSQQQNYAPSNVVFGDFLNFLKDDVAENPAFKAYINESDMKMLKTFGALIPNKNKTMTPQELFEELNKYQKIEPENIKFLLTYKDSQDGKFESANFISVQAIMNYLVANKENFSSAIGDNYANLVIAQNIINNSVEKNQMTPEDISNILGMEISQAQSLYLLYKSENDDTGSWKLSPKEFISFAISDVLGDEMFASYFDEATSAQLLGAGKLVDAVISERKIPESEMYALFSNLSEQITAEMMELLYLYYAGSEAVKSKDAAATSDWTLTIPEMFAYISEEMVNDERFAVVLDESTKKMIADSKPMLEAAAGQMKAQDYSRLIFMTNYPDESDETLEFVADLDKLRQAELQKDSYLIGVSPMVYEMETKFSNELLLITAITTVAIFAVVLLSFRNVVVALLLTMLVQCGVFITVAIIGWLGGSIYYLALLIVQSILMGATIDYAIVLSNYYRENRKTLAKLDALKVAYQKSIHTIATSGSILIFATAVLGIFSTVAIIKQVCSAIALGSLVAVILILLILPGMLVAFDRVCVSHKNK